MCGIYGYASLQNTANVDSAREHCDRMKHRGPDDSGIWLSPDGRAVLAHRRLSILDLSPLGHQPMLSPDNRCVVTFNGEIYNYVELRNDLKRLGYQFRGDSDTEVLLAAYQQWNLECLDRLNGMFAFAIYDAGDAQTPPVVFFARDRIGKKPFYYSKADNKIEFASELKALSASGKIDLRALNFYLALGYIPKDLCIRRGVNKLPPAHAGLFRLSDGNLKTWRYWTPPENKSDIGLTGSELADIVSSLIEDSVRLRFRSDVPVGVLLSGGLDSSLVAAFAARSSHGKIKTFTVSNPGTAYDEAPYAQIVARYIGSEHHVLSIESPSLSVLREIEPFIDEPLADSSLIPSYLVSKLTVGHVKVALGGDGGDELFGGYSDYPTALADNDRFSWIPQSLMRLVSHAAGILPAGVKGRNRIYALRGGPYESLIWGSPYFDAVLRRRILGQDQSGALGDDLEEPERWLLSLFMTGNDPVDCMTRTHFGSIMPDDFLVKVDRMSMAVSLEMRSPLLDYRLAEFAFSNVPSRWKVFGSETRRIQKILAGRLLPPDLNVDRKQGFSIPINDWLRSSKCMEAEDSLVNLPDAIDKGEVRKLISGHMQGRANGSRLFALIMLGIACRQGTNYGYVC